METTAEAITKRIKNKYTNILQLCQNVPESALTEPISPNGWSVKDTIAHIAAWDWRCASLLSEVYDTDTPLTAHPDVDALNLEIHQEREGWSWEEVVRDFREAHQFLLKSIRALPPERLNDSIVQQSIIEETCEHYNQHLPDLEHWHEKVASKVKDDEYWMW
jgi:hypothetical protein